MRADALERIAGAVYTTLSLGSTEAYRKVVQ
jgi:hypothetical protein